jgi:5'-3' exonuclease
MKILVVDLASVTRRFFELEKTQSLTDGSALSASVQLITRASDGYDRVVIVRDLRPSFRHSICPTYKAGRQDPGPVYTKLEVDVATRLYQDGASVYPNNAEAKDPRLELMTGGFPEADDTIASIVAWYLGVGSDGAVVGAPPDGWCLTILSQDSDLCALVSDQYRIDVRRLEGTIWREEDVIREFGCKPEMIPHVKALGGDTADGYKPFPHPDAKPDDAKTKPGIGTKKAIELLSTWGKYGDGPDDMRPGERVLWAAQDGLAYETNNPGKGPPPGSMPDCHERRCLVVGGTAAIKMGYGCATMRDDLPLDFSRILAAPVVRSIVPPKKTELAAAAAALAKPTEPAPMVLRQSDNVGPRRDRNSIERYALQPRRFDELVDTAQMLYDARMFPQFSTWQGIAGAALVAGEQGIGIGQALRGTYVVEGKLSFSAALIASLVRRSSSCKILRLIPEECDDRRATVEFQRDDMAKPARYVFTIEMAARMRGGSISARSGGNKTKWETQPHLMLCWAALREVCRLYWYDISAGMYTPDELRSKQDLSDDEFEATGAEVPS